MDGGHASDTQKLLNCWDRGLGNMHEELSDHVKRGLLYRRVVSSVSLKEGLAHFRREKAKGEDAESYTYSFQRLSIERLIANDRQDKNLADRTVNMLSGRRRTEKPLLSWVQSRLQPPLRPKERAKERTRATVRGLPNVLPRIRKGKG